MSSHVGLGKLAQLRVHVAVADLVAKGNGEALRLLVLVPTECELKSLDFV